MKKPSPVIQLLDLTWASVNGSTAHSWERVNHAMYRALCLAIDYGFEFDEDDWKYIAENYRSGYWLGERGVAGFYERCICGGDGKHRGGGRTDHNISAIKSLEKYLGREPVRFDGYRLHEGAVIQFWFPDLRVKTERLALEKHSDRKSVAANLKNYKNQLGTRIKITSIDDAKGIWQACEYAKGSHGKPTKRHKLTAQNFRDHETWFNATWFPKTKKEGGEA